MQYRELRPGGGRADGVQKTGFTGKGDAFFSVDTDWRFTYLDETACPIVNGILGETFTLEELRGRHLWDELPKSVTSAVSKEFHEAMDTGESVSFEAYLPPVEEHFSVRAYPSENGLSVYLRNVGERRRRKLETQVAVLREVDDVMTDEGRTFEEKVEALLAIGCRELDLNYGTLSRIHDRDYVFEVVQAPDDSIRTGDVVDVTETNCERTVHSEATLILADVATEAPELTDRAGFSEWGISCYIGTPVVVAGDTYGTFCFYDTEPQQQPFSDWEAMLVELMAQWVSYELASERATEQLRRQNERLDEFAAVVSHDLRNPLAVIQGSIALAEETGEQEHFDRSNGALERMEQLIDDLLLLARTGESHTTIEPVDLRELGRTAWSTVDTGTADLEIVIDRTVHADPTRLRQLLENLFRNAVEHGRTNPEPDATHTEETETDPPDVTVTMGALDSGFFVEDDGPGIPEDDRERAFEFGYTTAADGTGLGLSIVSEIVDAHGWTVTLTDGTDGGARFEITDLDRP